MNTPNFSPEQLFNGLLIEEPKENRDSQTTLIDTKEKLFQMLRLLANEIKTMIHGTQSKI